MTATLNGCDKRSGTPTEQDLFRQYRSSPTDGYRDGLLERYLPLVREVAEYLAARLPRFVDVEDLASMGQFGLLDAIKNYNPELGVKFKTYAMSRIRGSILDEIRSQDWVPRLVRIHAVKVDRARQELESELNRSPTYVEMAEKLGVSWDEYHSLLEGGAATAVISLSDEWTDHEEKAGSRKIDLLEDDRQDVNPLRPLLLEEYREGIFGVLRGKERTIVELYTFTELSMKDIGKKVRLTESRVCQIYWDAMERLRQTLEPWYRSSGYAKSLRDRPSEYRANPSRHTGAILEYLISQRLRGRDPEPFRSWVSASLQGQDRAVALALLAGTSQERAFEAAGIPPEQHGAAGRALYLKLFPFFRDEWLRPRGEEVDFPMPSKAAPKPLPPPIDAPPEPAGQREDLVEVLSLFDEERAERALRSVTTDALPEERLFLEHRSAGLSVAAAAQRADLSATQGQVIEERLLEGIYRFERSERFYEPKNGGPRAPKSRGIVDAIENLGPALAEQAAGRIAERARPEDLLFLEHRYAGLSIPSAAERSGFTVNQGRAAERRLRSYVADIEARRPKANGNGRSSE